MSSPLNSRARRTLAHVDLRNPLDDHELNQGRVAWWLALPGRFGGTIWWDLVHQLPGTINVGSWYPFSNPGGNGSIFYNGSSSYVDASTNIETANLALGNMSVGCWFNATAFSAAEGNQMVGRSNGLAASDEGWVLGYIGTNNIPGASLGFVVNSTGSTPFATYTYSTTGQWHHLLATYTTGLSASNITLYLDGVKITPTTAGNGTGTLDSDSTQSLQIGAESGSTSSVGYGWWNGYLNDISLWNRILTAQEVFSLYQLSKVAYPGVLRRRNRTAFSVPAGGLTSITGQATFTGVAQLAPGGQNSLGGGLYLLCPSLMSPASSLDLSGSSELTGATQLRSSSSIALAGSTELLGTTILNPTDSIALAAFLQLLNVGQLNLASAISLAGQTTLDAMTILNPASALALSGDTSLLANSALLGSPQLSLAGQTSLLVATLLAPYSSLSLAGSTVLTGATLLCPSVASLIFGAVLLTGIVQLSSNSSVLLSGDTELTVNSCLVPNGQLLLGGEGILTGVTSLVSLAGVYLAGVATLAAEMELLSNSGLFLGSSAHLLSNSQVLAYAGSLVTSSAQLLASSLLNPNGFLTLGGDSLLAASSALLSLSQLSCAGQIIIDPEMDLQAFASVFYEATAFLDSFSILTGTAFARPKLSPHPYIFVANFMTKFSLLVEGS